MWTTIQLSAPMSCIEMRMRRARRSRSVLMRTSLRPLVDPAIVIENRHRNAKVQVVGWPQLNSSVRVGASQVLKGRNIMAWCPLEIAGKLQVRVEPTNK